jgi:hypothetical protein
MAEKCKVTLQPRDRFDSFHPSACGRPIQEGTDKCKLHNGVEQRRKAAAEEAERKRAVERERRERAERQISALRALPGVNQINGITLEYGGFKEGYTGRLVISPDAADKILDLLR